jgi:homospermidine synthase
MGFKYAGTATTVQVCSSVNSAIEWILRNPNKGYNSPEFLNHREVLKATAPYLGSLYFGWIC